jgi:hypothetical protein
MVAQAAAKLDQRMLTPAEYYTKWGEVGRKLEDGHALVITRKQLVEAVRWTGE